MISHSMVTAKSVESSRFRGRYVRAGRVVGMDQNHGSRARCGSFVERVEIDLPSVVVEERIGNELQVGQIGEKLEQRIARFGRQNLVSGIAEQAKNIRVCFAGAGGQKQ